MSLEESIRLAVREEVRAALDELRRELLAGAGGATAAGEKLPVIQAAAKYGPSPATIAKWFKAGRLTRYGRGRSTRVDVAELLKVMREDGERHTEKLSEAEIEQRVEAQLRRHG